MYSAFCDFLRLYGYSDDAIFEAFEEMCAENGWWLHEALVSWRCN